MKSITALILFGTIALAVSSNTRGQQFLTPGFSNPSQLGSGIFNPSQMGSGMFNPGQLGSGVFNPGSGWVDPSQLGSNWWNPGQIGSGWNPFGQQGTTCTPQDRNRQCFAYNPELSCIYYTNGRRETDYIDHCSGCRDTNISAIYRGCCPQDNVYPPTVTGVCTPEERDRQCLTYNPVQSCVCYMNGTCVNTKADRCTDCGNENIYSINKGYCRSLNLGRANDICQPGERGVRCFANIPVISCVCYFNGTCTTQDVDRCMTCSQEDVASVSKGCCSSNQYGIGF